MLQIPHIHIYDNHIFYAINPDGTRKWSFETPGKIGSSPSVSVDGAIYFGSDAFGTDEAGFYALNPDGSVKWKALVNQGIISSPAIGKDGTVYVTSWDQHLYAFGGPGEWQGVKEGQEVEGMWNPNDEGIDCFNPGSSEIEEKCDIFCYDNPDLCPGYFDRKKGFDEKEFKEEKLEEKEFKEEKGFFLKIIDWFKELFR